jgi:LPPG:FO 2-phospho-L-lactate transferase
MAILEPTAKNRNLSLVALCGGVGGARLMRALDELIPWAALTAVVNVGDDETRYGVHVAADIDTVLYTLADIVGPHGWGIDGDATTIMNTLSRLGVDTTFQLGDRDFAHCLWRTHQLAVGSPLSATTSRLAATLGVRPVVLPVSDDPIATAVQIADGSWLSFQQYFVERGHRDEVRALRYDGADTAVAAPGVLDAIAGADAVIVAPSNPPLSIWPMLAIPGIRSAVEVHRCVIAVSPLFSGKALKGPAEQVLLSLGMGSGTQSILAAYDSLVDYLIVDSSDSTDVALSSTDVTIEAADTRLTPVGRAHDLVTTIARLAGGSDAT